MLPTKGTEEQVRIDLGVQQGPPHREAVLGVFLGPCQRLPSLAPKGTTSDSDRIPDPTGPEHRAQAPSAGDEALLRAWGKPRPAPDSEPPDRD